MSVLQITGAITLGIGLLKGATLMIIIGILVLCYHRYEVNKFKEITNDNN